jgi:outer membrane protein assembly factor BamB
MFFALLAVCCGCSREPLPAPGSPSPASPDSFWPRFHGADGSNISPDTGLLTTWPSGGPRPVWAAEGIGEGFAGVTIAEGRIFTAGNIDGRTVVTALDLTGRTLWQADNGEAWTDSPPGNRGTPTVDGDRVFHESPLGNVVCLDAATGKQIWTANILQEYAAENIKWALAESLLVDGDRVICCPFGHKASIAALNRHTGRTLWIAAPVPGDKAGYASPTLCKQDGLPMILTMSGKALVAVNAESGNLLFVFEHVTKYDVNALMPLYHDGRVFISSGYGRGSVMVKITVEGNAASAEKVWSSEDLDNHHGGVVLLDGYLYGASEKKWICLDWETGQTKYAEKGVGKGSLTAADGMLYTLNEKRKVGLVRATPEGHELVSSFSIPSGGSGPTWAHPVVVGGCLYVRHGDFLYAYDVRAGG